MTYSMYPEIFNVSGDIADKIMSCLNMNKSAAMDQISAKFLKIATDVLTQRPI